MRYFPILRGKQFELLALRDIAATITEAAQGSNVCPIVEPVRSDIKGLQRMSDELEGRGIHHGFILNPQVGDLASRSPVPELVEFVGSRSPNHVHPVLYIPPGDLDDVDYRRFQDIAEQNERWLLLDRGTAPGGPLEEYLGTVDSVQIGMPVEVRKSRYRRIAGNSTFFTVADNFPAQARNLDYVTLAPRLFTDEHLYAADDGFSGFGDYLTMGSGFTEGGFMPRVVAIHWTYAMQSGEIWLRHFTSAPSEIAGNAPGKFLEAGDSLVEFLDQENIQTVGANVMRQYLARRQFPGLGTVKKLSVMNHLELVNSLL